MGIAFVGCGFVADFYASNARGHADLEIRGAFDISSERLETFTRHHRLPARGSLQEILADPGIELVVNLTSPHCHAEVTAACLEAGKHVYSEKPLGMTPAEAANLAATARRHGRRLGCAPCSILSPTAQTLWKAIRDGVVGRVRLVYANYDDGRIAPRLRPWTWRSESGAPWPAREEFSVGCTFEHAGYFLTWLAAFFGPARRVTAFSSCQIPDKGIPVDRMAPDFSVGCIEYDEGIVARVTCGLLGPQDKSLTIVGDEGTLQVGSLRNETEPVYVQRFESTGETRSLATIMRSIRHRYHRAMTRGYPAHGGFAEALPFAVKDELHPAARDKHVDFCRGVSEMAEAIRTGRSHRLSAELGVHICELIETLQYPERFERPRSLSTDCGAVAPLPWHQPPLAKGTGSDQPTAVTREE
jgi:predicted dehydrogenase